MQTFCSSRFASLMAEYGIEHRRASPLHPRANGEVERVNRSINKVVKTAIAEGRNWRFALDDCLLAYSNTPLSVTGTAPAVMMFVRNLNDKLPVLNLTAPKKINHASFRDQDARSKEKSKQYHDRKHRASPHKLKAGDTVFIRNERQKIKTEATLESGALQGHYC